MNAIKIFISYSHKDEKFKDELLEFLNPLQRAGEIEIWNDRAIMVGDKWDKEIVNAIEECNIILFLISRSFLASNYINDVEITKAMQLHQSKSLRLVPILIKNCDLKSHIVKNQENKISDYQGLPTNMQAVNTWRLRDDAWMDVIRGLKILIKSLKENNSLSTYE